MKLNLFMYKNNYLGCTGRPIFDDHDADIFKKGMERFFLTGELEKIFTYENTDLYHLGSYDDETMKFELLDSPLLLLRCSEIISSRKIKEQLIEEAKKRESKEEVITDGK